MVTKEINLENLCDSYNHVDNSKKVTVSSAFQVLYALGYIDAKTILEFFQVTQCYAFVLDNEQIIDHLNYMYLSFGGDNICQREYLQMTMDQLMKK